MRRMTKLCLVLLLTFFMQPVWSEEVTTRYHRVVWDGLQAFPIEEGVHKKPPPTDLDLRDAPYRLCYDSLLEAIWKDNDWLGVRFRGKTYAVERRGTRPWGDEPSLPSTNQDGDYSPECAWSYWTVVDQDPNGLNGRLLESYKMDLTTEGTAGLPVSTWPVVERFPTGLLLNAIAFNRGPLSQSHWLIDDRGHPWLLVKRRGQRSFVRANRQYVQPVQAATFKDRGDR